MLNDKKCVWQRLQSSCGWTRLQLRWSRANIIRGWRWTSLGVRAAMCLWHTAICPNAWAFPSAQFLSEAQNCFMVGGCHFLLGHLCTHIHTLLWQLVNEEFPDFHGEFLPVAYVIDLLSFLEINEVERQHGSTWRSL